VGCTKANTLTSSNALVSTSAPDKLPLAANHALAIIGPRTCPAANAVVIAAM
jgi:hypothetical protein